MSVERSPTIKPIRISDNPYVALVVTHESRVLGKNIEKILIGKGSADNPGEPDNPDKLAVITVDTSDERREKTGLRPSMFFAALLASLGLSDSDIGTQRYIAQSTVKTHLIHAYSRTGVRRRGGIARYLLSNEVFNLDGEKPCPKFGLLPRHAQTLNELSYGESYAEAAHGLFIGTSTAKCYLERAGELMSGIETPARILCAFASREITLDMPSEYQRRVAAEATQPFDRHE